MIYGFGDVFLGFEKEKGNRAEENEASDQT
jgi:hypothetical protein